MLEYAQPMYHTTPVLSEYHVICGNGHQPFSRPFQYAEQAQRSAELHDRYVHHVELDENGEPKEHVASITRVYVNLPV